MDAAAETSFGDYVVARSLALCRFAYLLCGDWHRAEDAVQIALIKLYVRWDHLGDHAKVDAYVRRSVMTTVVDRRRRTWFRHEQTSRPRSDEEVAADLAAAAVDRLTILAALAQVAPRQRAALVLRYWEDLTVEQVAQLLDCSVGTVKSQTARGLRRLRRLLDAGS